MRSALPVTSLVARCGLGCLALALVSVAALAQDAPWPTRAEGPQRAPAEDAPAWLDAGDAAQLEAFIGDAMLAKHIPGLSAAIVRDGELSWSGAFGMADPYLGVPVDESTLFMLASISKTVTGAALLQLVDDGLLDLDDPVGEHLPFPVVHPLFPGTAITARMLLTHTSGLSDNWGAMPYYPGDPTYALHDYLFDYLTPGGALYDAAKNFKPWAPGSAYSYCNNALALVGLMVEHVSGVSFPERCASELFAQLGMPQSAWFLADLDPDQVAMPCAWNGSAYTPYGQYGFADYPSGQLRTSAVQLARFLGMVIDGGQCDGAAILEPTTADALTTPQVPAIDPSQGLVWYSWHVGGRSVWGHNGGDQGVSTEMWFDPATGIGVVVLTNGEAWFSDIIDALFDHAEQFPPATSLTTDVTEVSASAADQVRFTVHGGSLDAGRFFVLLGSLSGSSPGTPLPGGHVTLPLNWDPVTDLIVSAINTPMFASFHGSLGPSGLGRASWNTLGPLPSALVGYTVTFAGAFQSPWDYVTNPVEIAIAP